MTLVFSQKPIIQVLILISTGLQPSSACNIYAGVDFFEFVMYVRNSFCSFSMILVFQKPKSHIHKAQLAEWCAQKAVIESR